MSKQLTIKSIRTNKQTLQYGDNKITYQVFFIPKQKATIIIDVLPNGSVQVKAPEATTLKDIKLAVHKRTRWIHNHITKIKHQLAHVLPRQYVSGESHYYLGRRYILKVILVKNKKPQVKLLRGQLQVHTQSRKIESIKELLHIWYVDHAEKVFERRLKSIILQIPWLKQIPPWKIRAMKKQWGNCSPQGILSLNPYLVKAPRECVDYVILHELCHLKEHNHSKKFYSLLGRFMPEWKSVKVKLDGMSEFLLAE
ncbi:Putative predicted metal-dependent hydrolase [hydrothermal vent metagenome]|uniref:Predicted metal-dependent hydrolase n=1 Tax=hydrothermal vent metagenome TaxID=652676 RepID=A0A3B1B7K5_9ZZZZ